MSEKTYRLRTVRDFLSVPDDKVADCLYDFSAWLYMVRAVEQSLHISMVRDSDTFAWVDDGAHVARVALHGPNSTHEIKIDLASLTASGSQGEKEEKP